MIAVKVYLDRLLDVLWPSRILRRIEHSTREQARMTRITEPNCDLVAGLTREGAVFGPQPAACTPEGCTLPKPHSPCLYQTALAAKHELARHFAERPTAYTRKARKV